MSGKSIFFLNQIFAILNNYCKIKGDSGGPLLCQSKDDKNRWFVGGIVSWGIMCAHPKLPGVYANVPKYIPWIMQQMHNFSNPTSRFKLDN